MHKRSIWMARLIVLGVSILLTLVIFDVFVRISGRDKPLLWEPHARLGWRHIPNASRIGPKKVMGT